MSSASRTRSLIRHPHEHYNGAAVVDSASGPKQYPGVAVSYYTQNPSNPPSAFRVDDPTDNRISHPRHSARRESVAGATSSTHDKRVRNSLHKPSPASRRLAKEAPGAHNETVFSSIESQGTIMQGSAGVPPRPSRQNTETLHDLYNDGVAAYSEDKFGAIDRRSSLPALPQSTDQQFYADASEPLPPMEQRPPMSRSRSRSGTVTQKPKKGVLSFMSGKSYFSASQRSDLPNPRNPLRTDFLTTTKKPEISTPYDPVHLTHVGFNSSTGEFTGLPKEWQQLLQESGISRLEQERNPQAVMEIVKFYQEGHGEVWDKMGHVHGEIDDALARKMKEAKISTPDLAKGFVNPVRGYFQLSPQRLHIISTFTAVAPASSNKEGISPPTPSEGCILPSDRTIPFTTRAGSSSSRSFHIQPYTSNVFTKSRGQRRCYPHPFHLAARSIFPSASNEEVSFPYQFYHSRST